jgi:hypothetical protein
MRPRDRLQEQIDAWYAEALMSFGPDLCRDPQRQLLIDEVDDFDSDSFLRGLDAGLYQVKDGYRICTELAPKKRDGTLSEFHLFERVGDRCQMRQETIAHYAAAAELVLDYEWPTSQVAIESPAAPGLLAGALDIVVFADAARSTAIIGGEAKARRAQLTKLLAGMRKCGARPLATPAHPSFEHKKCVGLMAFRPALFLAIASGERGVYATAYDSDEYELGNERLDPERLRA